MNPVLTRTHIDHMPGEEGGQKSDGERNGKRGTRTSLIAAKPGEQLLAPVLFQGSTNAL